MTPLRFLQGLPGNPIRAFRFGTRAPGLWEDRAAIRAELFGTERLEHHALSLAAAQDAAGPPARRVQPLTARVSENADALLGAYRSCARTLHAQGAITPAAEWLLDNFFLVQQQLQNIADDLPPGYYRQLPKLATGPFAGYPRVLGLAWAYVAHTDSLLSGPVLTRFVASYQTVSPLTIGELWAVAITLRIVLIENMRRLADQITQGNDLRAAADAIVDQVMAAQKGEDLSPHEALHSATAGLAAGPLPEIVAARIAKRLRGFDPAETPLHAWLEERLQRQGSSIEMVVQNAHMRQGASNVTMRNIVTSMRLASEMDWADFVEDVSLIDARLRARSDFARLDFVTRNSYRTAIEVLARSSALTEIEVTDAAIRFAARGETGKAVDAGFGLIGPGRSAFEKTVGFVPPWKMRMGRSLHRLGLPGYLGSAALATTGVLVTGLWGAGATGPAVVALAVTGLLTASEAGLALVNLGVTRTVRPAILPGLDLATGIPTSLRTVIAVPVLLRNTDDLQVQMDQLEVHHLSSVGGALHYLLLSDGPDAETETTPCDAALIAVARSEIGRLNACHPSEHGDRFLFLHRHRRWNPSEGVWMGWERKRGKLEELNRLLRGATDTSFLPHPAVPRDVRFVITLDADTRLLRDTVARMVGKMAHPLNRAMFDPARRRVIGGYGILQPRVTPTLPTGTQGSLFQQVYSSTGGIEPYAAATSNIYQDLFGEGSFTGKGIYDVDAFAASLAGRVPDNTLLSHDLFEGDYARAGLASDLDVLEEYPAHYDVSARRQHRWARGDWQLLPWLIRKDSGLTALGRWKMIDNLRRSLLAPLTLATLLAGWLLPLPVAIGWTIAVLTMLALPHLIGLPFAVLPGRAGITSRSHLAALLADARTAAGVIGLNVAFLADTAWQMADACSRTLVRLLVTRKHLLEWTTAAAAAAGRQPGPGAQYRQMAGGLALGSGTFAAALAFNPAVWSVALPFAALWLAAPAIAHRVSRPLVAPADVPLLPPETQRLRLIARRTWRYFETFVTEADHFLPPDNFQETPSPIVFHRTSPTNIGLYLLSAAVARDMGWISQNAALTRLEQTLQTLQRMPRFRGHLYNWHDTLDLRVLDPAYVSSVDSGNLAGHLIAVAQACREWQGVPVTGAEKRAGLIDALLLARQALASDSAEAALLDDLTAKNARQEPFATLLPVAIRLADKVQAQTGPSSDATFWCGAARDCIEGHLEDEAGGFVERLADIETLARSLALEMDFAFLLDPEKKLLSIGFAVSTNTRDPNCYDLLASEARLASLFAIAKGDVATRHWFRLGRAATPIGAGSALISWSGSMFEYLMPSLVMRAPAGSVLEQTNRLVVAQQIAYGTANAMPWGVSESSYNARDLDMTYQYSNFGVPGLGLKRGLSAHRVVAPYATGLAAMVDPRAALRNFARLTGIGAEGRYGFYEAIDFTAQRLPAGADLAIVQSYMAHHQGMTITAIANVLQGGGLRARFHAEPMIRAVELLLQERVPRDATVTPPRAEDVSVQAVDAFDVPVVRRFEAPGSGHPTGHLLSNGRYGVMLTPTGAGFSTWRDLAITRWRADRTQDALGSFILARDVSSGAIWSSGVQPTGTDPDRHTAVLSEHHATFVHQGSRLTMTTEVVVSAEDDAEARRVTLTNTGNRPREIDLTSYAELVLAPAAADLAHPAFSKMFVVTDFLPELGVLVATRRRRAPTDPEVWAAHLAVVEGDETAAIQYETDRARFIGRGRCIGTAAMADTSLSNTIGTVLDPILSIRRRVLVPSGGMARVTFWTLVAETPEELLDRVDRHRDPSAFERAVTLSWTQGQVQLRHLGVTSAAAADFQRLGGMILRGDPRLRAPARLIEAGAAPQSALWPLGISGDLPILLFQISDTEDIAALHEVLAAHEYLRMRLLDVDLVILNDRASSYVQDMQTAIDVAVRSAQSRPRSGVRQGLSRGGVHTLRADLVSPDVRSMLLAVARVVLLASRGSIGDQIDALPSVHRMPPARRAVRDSTPLEAAPPVPDLEFFNGTGGFADDGREYVTILRDGQTTPMPWINVIANPAFGFHVSAEGSGSVWSENSRENQLTPWSNDPVTDPSGEAMYLCDLDSGALWTPTALPIRGRGTYTARHGFGYSSFAHSTHGIDAEMTQFVPMNDPVKITRLTLRNTGTGMRRLAVTAYAEWVLGTSRSVAADHVITTTDSQTGAMFARNPFGTAFPGRIAFADLGVQTSSMTGDRTEVLGRGGTMAAPAGIGAMPFSGRTGPALDPCAALQRHITLAPGESATVIFLLGQALSAEAARALIRTHRAADPAETLGVVRACWSDLLTSVQVKTPDRSMDMLLNGWLLYQTLACRIWARAGFYQASGAYGFRDQLQDGMALSALRPEMTRAHLLQAASRQFPEGDVQHWWLPHSGQGVRTRISDDRVWLGFAVAHYICVTGDAAILSVQIPFLDGPALAPGVHDDFFQPTRSELHASLFEHCARGIDQAIDLTGTNGMPLIGTGDWNDGMNRVGEGGQGTSVWLGWLLIATIDRMAPLADTRDTARADRWRAHAASMAAAIEREGWDGAWYRRGTFDNGTLLGAASSDECRIDSIAQSWAVLSGAADPVRAATAMASMTEHLVRQDPGLALLFTPPFDHTARDPGYIKGYPPGLRENGGQYSHAAMWAILAHAKLGDGDGAGALFSLLNPINHSRTPADANRYKVEPYVVAADVYSIDPHAGRGGWTWYTGSAAWMYRAGIEGLLGLRREGQELILNPCFPKAWPRVEATVRTGDAHLTILIENPGKTGHRIGSAILNNVSQPIDDGTLRLRMAKGNQTLCVRLQ